MSKKTTTNTSSIWLQLFVGINVLIGIFVFYVIYTHITDYRSYDDGLYFDDLASMNRRSLIVSIAYVCTLILPLLMLVKFIYSYKKWALVAYSFLYVQLIFLVVIKVWEYPFVFSASAGSSWSGYTIETFFIFWGIVFSSASLVMVWIKDKHKFRG